MGVVGNSAHPKSRTVRKADHEAKMADGDIAHTKGEPPAALWVRVVRSADMADA
jgi:hypothetical protein